MSAKTAMPASARPAASVAKPPLTRLNAAKLQRACACGSTSVGQSGQCSECGKAKSQSLQRAPSGSSASSTPTSETQDNKKKKNEPILQRLAAGSAPAHHTADPDDNKKKDPLLQRKAQGQSAPVAVPPSVGRTLDSPGRSLDSATRNYMEPLFGRDFSNVRVHNDSQAAASARDVDARAYTVGDHITFAGGEYRPHTPEGQALLAHELAHTVQQSGLQRQSADMSVDTAVNSPLEREANAAANAVLRGERPTSVVGRPARSAVQRAPWGGCPYTAAPDKGVVSASSPDIYNLAEDAMVAWAYKERGRGNITTNKEPLGTVKEEGAEKQMKEVAADKFHRHEYKKLITTVDPKKAQGLADEASQSPTGTASMEVEPQGALLRPDITDWNAREVYDVTTDKQAQKKIEKVQMYVDKLNAIRLSHNLGGDPWRPGTTLNKPTPDLLSFAFNKSTIKICFGSTDLQARPGVLSYEPIETGVPGAAASAVVPADTEEYFVKAGNMTLTFAVPKQTNKKMVTIPLDGPNAAEAKQAPGVVLIALTRRNNGPDTITAVPKQGTKDSIPIAPNGKSPTITFSVDSKTRQLKNQPLHTPIAFDYPKLSLGKITKINYTDADGLTGVGEITPSLKLLSKVKLQISVGPDKLDVTSSIQSDKMNVPIPGFKVTKADLGLTLHPEFKPTGTIAFKIGPGGKNWVDGVLTASADEQGFIATGDVNAHVPGMDETTGKFTYRYTPGTGGAWSGEIKLSSSKIPRVKKADVVMALDDKGIQLSGGLAIDLPGAENELELTIKRDSAGNWIFGGKTKFKVPVHGVDPVELTFWYDIGRNYLKGEGSTGFEVKGLHGHITVHYDNGKISGKGSLHVDKGRVKGDLDPVEMDEHGKFSGKGTLQYQLTDDLLTTITVEMTKDQEVTVTGEIAFTKPIPLFGRIGGDKEIFSTDVSFPIPGLSIGIIGVNGHIGGSLSAGYYLGPGVIRKLKVSGKIKPLEEHPDAEVALSGEFYVPAGAHISGEIHAGVGVDVIGGLAGVDGNIGVTATAQLDGEVKAPFDASYKDHVFAANAGFDFHAAVKFTLGLHAYIIAYAGFSVFKVEHRWDWPIA